MELSSRLILHMYTLEVTPGVLSKMYLIIEKLDLGLV